ncbi:MAG TPA: imidazolonepropionase [Candidatus Limnocylindria bacterium]|nr:imidazolonepropionase [Candidatus Limnocylindria bacterium]
MRGASEIATLAGGLRRGSAQDDVGLLRTDDRAGAAPAAGAGPALAAYEGRIVAVGSLPEVERQLDGLGIPSTQLADLDAGGCTVTPGLIDPHTHLLFAGTRHAELALRQRGHGYLEILAAGGGILQTVRQTRAATDEELLAGARRWLGEMLRHGTTTVEVKSGYGLDTQQELRLLGLAGRLAAEGPLEVVPTFLGAHAVAPEFRGRTDGASAYLDSVIGEQLPRVAEQGIATACDVFCEETVFDVPGSRRLLDAARALGLAPRLHADELHASGGAELAAELGARSADHLAAVGAEGIEALGRAADEGRPVVATLLPATTLYLLGEHYAPARALIERGVPVALGSDFNPGTSPTPNLQLVMSLACLKLGLSPAEALAGMTVNAAAALDLEETTGSLEVGKHADLVLWEVQSHELLPYWLGADLIRAVVKRGRLVHQRA